MSKQLPNYLSTSNMSDIKQSIGEQYSMDFDNQQQAISQMISMSKTGKNVSMSKQSKIINAKKANINQNEKQKQQKINSIEQIKQDLQNKQNHQQINKQKNNNQPAFLGQKVFNIIKERYQQIQKTQTNDPDVLFQFYKRQRKTLTQNKNTKIKVQDLGALLPSTQRKLMIKMQFEKILTYYPHDIYYTLACGAQKYKKDLQVEKKKYKLQTQMMKKPQNKKKNIKQVVDRLYSTKDKFGQFDTTASKKKIIIMDTQQIQRQKRMQFINQLRKVYHDKQKTNLNSQPVIQSAQKLHQFWQDMDNRTQNKVQWNQDTVKQTIRLYMFEQVQDLLLFFQKKLGFKQLNGPDMLRFYMKHYPIEQVHIPVNSFKEYINVYNQFIKEKQSKQRQLYNKHIKQQQIKIKQKQVKKFGRPVSATPISVLSKPKKVANFGQLAQKYSKDKLLGTLLHADKMKIARHAFQYGIYNLQEQVKVKGRVKPNQKQQFDKTVFKLLNDTYTNKNFFSVKDQDRVNDIMGQQNLQKQQTWKQLGPVLQQALLVKSYQNQWFRDALLRYASKTIQIQKYSSLSKQKQKNKSKSTQNTLKLLDDKTLIIQIIKYLGNLAQQDRKDELNNFDNVITASQRIHQTQQRMKKLTQKGDNMLIKQKRLFYNYLQQKACEYIDNRVKGKQVNLRKYLNQIFQHSLKQHKQFVIKHFHVVTGDKQCPKLLKYEFYRLQKQINPFTKQRDQLAKCHAWIPTKTLPQSFNYHTYNTFANIYQKDKNRIVAQAQKQVYKTTIWSNNKKMAKQRQVLMMAYSDAKQCVFHPKISKNI